MKNVQMLVKFPIKSNVVDLTGYKWRKTKKFKDGERPYQIELMVINGTFVGKDTKFPYYRYIRSTEHHQDRLDDTDKCDMCSQFKKCSNYGIQRCEEYDPMPRESIVVTQKHGIAWVMINSDDLQMEEE